MKTVYIAGRSGASGLVLHELMRRRADVRVLTPPDGSASERYEPEREAELLNAADVAVLCLPPVVVPDALARVTNPAVRVIDTSTRHSVAEGWAYGLPELAPGQRDEVRAAARVAGPGCFATGAVLALRPLIEWGVLDPAAPVCVHGVGGYTAGGKRMVERFERPAAPPPAMQIHGLDLHHPQVLEMQRRTGLQKPPLFVPLVGNFPRGTLVSVPLHRDWLAPSTSVASVRAALTARYADERLVSVKVRGLTGSIALPPTPVRGVELFVEGDDDLLLVARLDNLGKGSAVAALQNLNLLLGCDEFAGIDNTG